ncbi:MAG: 3-dehydroquinate synthase, partial [Oscillospiraceae bacterium]|nr:3-dehydroquinate synthase [Oscillospiraceae bacterium]
MMKTIRVQTAAPYDVVIGNGLLKDTGHRVHDIKKRCDTVCIITDSTVAPLYLDIVVKSLEDAGVRTLSYIFKSGEQSKNMETSMEIAAFLSDHYVTRRDLLAALGGGVTGDLAGFTASVYQRGMDYIQLPTTFLAAIDSSVGGKTAVNIPQGKNLVGSFWQPKLVLCDIDTLDTLSGDAFADGAAEAVKYGCIWDEALFDMMEREGIGDNVGAIIARCVQIKAQVVKEDEKDMALRQILNFGHTAAHALEKLSGFTVSHGRAVAMGMVIAARAGEKAGITIRGTSDRIIDILKASNLPVTSPYAIDD